MQDSQREINQLIEQNRYQQPQRKAVNISPTPTFTTESEHCLPIKALYIPAGITLLTEKDLTHYIPLPDQCIKSADINRPRERTHSALSSNMVILPHASNLRPNQNVWRIRSVCY